MTHPLTPREKVAEIVRDGMSRLAASQAGARPVVSASKEADRVTDAILTVLASGSGDHAELARWAKNWPAYKCTDVVVDGVLALLAENAALRAERDRIAEELHDEINYAAEQSVRATEAERKLAEAVEDKDDLKDRLSFATQLLRDYVDLTGGGHDVSVLNSETRDFLSKEAERG